MSLEVLAMPHPPMTLALALLTVATTALASEPSKGKVMPSVEHPGATSPPAGGESTLLPPAYRAPGPDVGMRHPVPGPRSPEWLPPGDPRHTTTPGTPP